MRFGIRKSLIYLVCMLIFISLAAFVIESTGVSASPGDQATRNLPQLPSDLINTGPIVGNDVCLGCHGTPGLSMTLLNGEVLDLYVNPDNYANSVHGQSGYACVQCHTNLGEYPHPLFTAPSLRDATLDLSLSCDRCHSGEYNLTMDSVHYDKLAIGIKEAAVCTDCHGSHDVHRWTDPDTNNLLPEARLDIPITCSRCHSAIYQKYRESVHGSALTDEANTDVPTCIDCHGVHNIGNPTTAVFRLKSPQLCAGCHTDPSLMGKYGISTNVLNTYVSDFHGTTVTLFEKQSPDSQTNKPVCYDCHGIHDISKVDNPETGIEMQQNLLVQCKKCHLDATSNFPNAWMSHYNPSPDHYPLVYYVNLFYKIFIPLVLGGMGALVVMDVGHAAYVKTRRKKSTQIRSTAKVSPPSQDENPPPQPPAEQDSEAGQHE